MKQNAQMVALIAPECKQKIDNMPPRNRFRHQSYPEDAPLGRWHLLRAEPGPASGSAPWQERMAHVGRTLRRAGVRAVYLMHGTFAGQDAFGLIRSLAHLFPEQAGKLRQLRKEIFDRLAKDTGNYTSQYADAFEQSTGVPVRRFLWSSENHHIGRADAAVRWVAELASLNLSRDQRVLVWAHSHGGNVLALVTNLLAADEATRGSFFRACRTYYRCPILGSVDHPVWPHVQRLLKTDANSRALPRLDVVTFGTPIRYGWDTGGYARLLHFVHHRPTEGHPPYRAVPPGSIDEVLTAAGGDYIQHAGIAGTNLPPHLIAWRTWIADVRLARLLEGPLRRRDFWRRLKAGMRVAEDGDTLLVDYGPVEGTIAEHLAGHAVYTRHHWLLFHAEQVAEQFYTACGQNGWQPKA